MICLAHRRIAYLAAVFPIGLSRSALALKAHRAHAVFELIFFINILFRACRIHFPLSPSSYCLGCSIIPTAARAAQFCLLRNCTSTGYFKVHSVRAVLCVAQGLTPAAGITSLPRFLCALPSCAARILPAAHSVHVHGAHLHGHGPIVRPHWCRLVVGTGVESFTEAV
jgi:hypothetical protein